MPTTPTGQLSGPLAALRELIAESATFQALVGAANATEALLKVYGVAERDNAEVPYAIVFETNSTRWNQSVGGFGPSALTWQLEAPIADGVDELEAFTAFANAAAAIADEVFEGSHTLDGALLIREQETTVEPKRTDPEREEEQVYFVEFRVQAGLEA